MSTVALVKLVSAERWRNWARTEATFVGRVHRPSSTAELVDVVRPARRRLTLVGSGHSWAPVARPDEEALSLERHDSLVRIDSAARTATVQAGMRLCDLNRVLAAHRLALPVLGTSSRQTVAGATATATHGTGARFQGLSSLIRSLELVTASGEVARVSEADNAHMFAAARASLGLLGVVAEVTLECERAFNLRLVERPTTLDAVLDRLDELLARNEHFKFWWWPHTQAARTWEYNRTDEADTTGPLFRLVRDDLAFIYPGWLGLLTARVLPSRIPQLAQAYARLFNRRRERTDRSDHAFTYPVPIRHFELEYGVPIDAAAEAVRGVRALIDRERLLVDFVLEVRFAGPTTSGSAQLTHVTRATSARWCTGQRASRPTTAPSSRCCARSAADRTSAKCTPPQQTSSPTRTHGSPSSVLPGGSSIRTRDSATLTLTACSLCELSTAHGACGSQELASASTGRTICESFLVMRRRGFIIGSGRRGVSVSGARSSTHRLDARGADRRGASFTRRVRTRGAGRRVGARRAPSPVAPRPACGLP